MATLNVFEMTNAELSKDRASKKSKGVKESVRRNRRSRRSKITADKIKVESIRMFKEEDEVQDYTPDDDVVVVVDPEMDDTPETVEDAESAAEDLIGSCVCKCSVCGANYVCSEEECTEALESEESECPVCGETAEQILVGEIAPAETAEDDVDDTDTEEDDVDVDEADVDADFDDTEDVEEEDLDYEDDEDYDESIKRTRRRTQMRRESASRSRRTPSKYNRTSSKRNESIGNAYDFDEVVLNRMLTKFAKENYENVRFVKIKSGKCRNGRLTFEGTVTTKKGNKRGIKLVAENFEPSAKMKIKFKEIGPFTEESISGGNSFVLDCALRGKVITPVSLKYSYRVKESRDIYEIRGTVMKEGVARK